MNEPSRFVIEDTLGSGAMGTVYRAQDITRGSTVALKVLHWADPTALLRFKTEFRSLANLAHPNLLQLYELVPHNDQYALSMELVEGQDFLSFVRSRGPASVAAAEDGETESIPPIGSAAAQAQAQSATKHVGQLDEDKLRSALRQLAEGLEALHRGGRLHCDLKPANVLVFRADTRLVICDFGLVMESTDRLRSERTSVRPAPSGVGSSRSGRDEVAGTLAFMSPEQASGGILSPASDWYSVGVMLYQALTAQLPFDPRLSWQDAVRAKLAQVPTAPEKIAPDVPRDLAKLAMHLLTANPAERAGYADVVRVLSGRSVGESKQTVLPELLIGREAELAQLEMAYAQAKAGTGTLVMLSGLSGMGKSALVRQLLSRCAQDDALVLVGRCYECEALPYKAVDPLMDALSSLLLSLDDPALVARVVPPDIAPLRAIFPVLSRVPEIAALPDGEPIQDPFMRKRRAAAVFKEVCRRLSRERPLVLYVDDLQWGDLDSGAFFTELLRGPDAPNLLLLFAYRAESEATSALIGALRARRAAGVFAAESVDVRIEALSYASARKLVETLLADLRVKEETLEAIVNEAQGSPFFLQELCAFLRTNGGEQAGALRLATVIEDRVAALPAASRTLLECVAVAGRPELANVLETASLLGSKSFAAAQVLKAHNLIQSSGVDAGTRIEAAHDRIRETVYRSLSEARRRELHRLLAFALEQTAESARAPRDMEALVSHWRGAGENARAVICAIEAADNAGRALAFGHAAQLYKQALELLPADAPERSQLEERLGNALMCAGRGGEAADAFLRAMEGATTERAQALRREALTQLLRAGQLERAFKGLEEAKDVLGVRFPSSNLKAALMLLWRKARIRLDDRQLSEQTGHASSEVTRQLDNLQRIAVALSSIDFLRGGVYTAEMTLRSLKTRDPRQVALALSVEALRSAGPNTKPAQTAWITERGQQLAQRSSDRYVVAVTYGTTGVSRYLEGRFEEALSLIRESIRIHQQELHGQFAWDLVIDRVFELRAQAQIGRVQEIVERVPEALRDAEQRGDIYAMSVMRLGRLCWAWLGLDQVEQAYEEVRTAERIWVQAPYQLFHYYALQSFVDAALYENRPELAFARLEREWKPMALVRKIQFCRVEAHYMRGRVALQLALRTGERKLLRLAQKDADTLANENAAWAAALGGLLRAAIVSHSSKSDACAMLGPLVRELTRLDMHLLTACARHRAGELTGGAEGTAEQDQSRAAISALGVKRPKAFLEMLAPGFVRP